jgi:DNA-binding IclR family transcriptional regulator
MKSADRALRVLQTLARHARPMPTMAIARACDVPKSSAHNLLNTMRALGFVSYYPSDHAWGLGPGAFEVGAAYLRAGPMERIARPELVTLANDTGTSAQLWAPVGAEVVCIDCVPPGGVRAALRVEAGTRLPIVGTAPGRAMMATLPPAQARLMPDPANPTGPREWGDPSGLEEVRSAGHAADDTGFGTGVGCIAAAVVARDGLPLGAVSIVHVAVNGDAERAGRLSAAVTGAASRLSGVIAGGVAMAPGVPDTAV